MVIQHQTPSKKEHRNGEANVPLLQAEEAEQQQTHHHQAAAATSAVDGDIQQIQEWAKF